ncbi:MAG: hypothetical protein K1Y02_00370 [Candidatus Hydrogenedentes bacterium]|nr:hypothetical protein [Candidatus Hydrogenedentota bacterium]
MPSITIRLGEIAHARSGDKGAAATLGIFAYTQDGYDFLRSYLTADRVEAFFKPMGCEKVKRYEVPNLNTLNFVLPEVLAGGGSRSLRVDAQGKAVGQVALEMPIEIEEGMHEACLKAPAGARGSR